MAEAALWRRDLFDNIARSARYTYEQSEEDRRAEKKKERENYSMMLIVYTLFFFFLGICMYIHREGLAGL